MTIYPIKFEPKYLPKIWGKELWLISNMPGVVSVVENGKYKGERLDDLIKEYREDLMGKGNAATQGAGFPLLVKIIEAEQTLSVQVHPNDVMAKARGESCGKDEMWYVMEAKKGAEIVAGLSAPLTSQAYEKHVNNHSFTEVLQYYKVSSGDVFSIPAGRVHALGGGIKVAEIQQASDTTFRIFDYNRRDKQGNLRELHVKQAEEAINYQDCKGDGLVKYSHKQNEAQPLVNSSSFTTVLYELTEPRLFDYSKIDSFVIWMCVEGECSLLDENGFSETMTCGEAVLIPAVLKRIHIDPGPITKILEIYIS